MKAKGVFRNHSRSRYTFYPPVCSLVFLARWNTQQRHDVWSARGANSGTSASPALHFTYIIKKKNCFESCKAVNNNLQLPDSPTANGVVLYRRHTDGIRCCYCLCFHLLSTILTFHSASVTCLQMDGATGPYWRVLREEKIARYQHPQDPDGRNKWLTSSQGCILQPQIWMSLTAPVYVSIQCSPGDLHTCN